jgi:hypothetical protein
MEQRERPAGVAVVAVLMALAGLAPLITTVATLGRGAPPLEILLNLLFAAVMLYVAWGLWRLNPSAWPLALLIQALNGVLAVITIVAAPRLIPPWISLVISAVVIVYLTRPHVRAAFGRPPAAVR